MEIKINIEKKYFFILLFAIVLIGGAIFVVAYNSATPNPSVMGHSPNEIDWSQTIESKIKQDSGDSTYDVFLEGVDSDGSRNLALLGVKQPEDRLHINFASEYSGGTLIGGPISIAGNGKLCLSGDCKSTWPSAGTLSCTTKSGWENPSNGWATSPNCDSGYTLTGGGGYCGGYNLFSSTPDGNHWGCGCSPQSTNSICTAICCKIV